MIKIIKRVALYLRVSTKEQADTGHSIEAQEEAGRTYASKNGFEVVKVYIDAGKSGSNTDREGLQEMLSDAKDGVFDLILVWKYDRFSRNLIDQEITILKLKKSNVEVKSITESDEELVRLITGSVNQVESKRTVERSKLVKLSRAKKGYWVGKVPFGYNLSKEKVLYPNEDASKVEFLYREFAKKKKNMAKAGRTVGLTKSAVWVILRNPVYKGYVVYLGEQYKGLHEAIIVGE